jgi:putative ABC transport system permease protein
VEHPVGRDFAVALRTLPIQDPDRLVVVSRINHQGKTRWMPLNTLSALARDSRTFESVCGYAEGGLFTTDPNGAPVQSPFELVSGGCYAMAGVKAHMGRLISEPDAPLAGEPARVAVLRYGFWQRHYGRDPAVLGRTIRADDLPSEPIGSA